MSSEAIIIALIAAAPGLLALVGQIKRDRATGEDIEDQITERVLKRANEEIAKLTARVAALERELEQYKIGVGLLMAQLIDNGLRPMWTPPGVKSTSHEVTHE
jgi:hypothetical protein